MSDATQRAFWETANEGFLDPDPAHDLLHLDAVAAQPHPALTETQYFGFNIPEENLQGLAYMWLHPNLKTVSGGAYVWTGIKEHNFECELFDFVNYMDSGDVFHNDLLDYTLENSYHVETLEPLKRHRIRYEDPLRQNSFDIKYEAIMPPMVLSSGLHLEQAMRTTGTVTLRGKEYILTGSYNVRDRSWGALRPEQHTSAPPMGWMTGIYDESFIFGCTAFDTPELSPDSYPGLEIPGGSNVKGGWIYRDGRFTPVVSVRKRTTRNPKTLIPQIIAMELTDAMGRDYDIQGEVVAAAGWRTWHNFEVFICLVRWEHEGQVFYGDLQECQWMEFVRTARRHQSAECDEA